MIFSLKVKTILLIVCIAAVISTLAIIIYHISVHSLIRTQYEERSVEIARLVAEEIDKEQLSNVEEAVRTIYMQSEDKVMSDQWGTPAFEAYVSQFEAIADMEDYQALLADLRRMQDAVDVDCLYLTWLDTENRCNVYLVDAAYEEPCPIGCIDPIFTDDPEVLDNLEAGRFPPNISQTPEYGWLVATGMPVHDQDGDLLAISAVDMSMNEIMARQHHFLLYVVLAFLVLTVLVCLIAIAVVNRYVVKPINTLTKAAAQYTINKQMFSRAKITSRDEIGVLAGAMAHMEEDINGYVSNLEQTTRELIAAREQAQQMDRAANIDALTKVRNKRAYDIEVRRLDGSDRPYGVVMIDLNGLKTINDTYGHEKGDISINIVVQVICQVFKHSAVYRVGGDEFIVILENNDFEERDFLIQSFAYAFRDKSDEDERPPWERVTAAIGCAVYDPDTEETADSVLKRADTAMYENKKAMKMGTQK